MGVVVWVFLNGAKHPLPASFSAKPGVKTCKVTDLHENIGILHFKVRRIRIYQRFCHSSRAGGVKNRDFDETSPFLMVFLVFVRKTNEPEAADSIFEISMFESIFPRFVCLQISCPRMLPGVGVQQFWWQIWNFQNPEKLQSGADFEGFGASREPLDLPSRAASWVLWFGSSTWCEALSSGEFFGKIRGQNMQSHSFAREH